MPNPARLIAVSTVLLVIAYACLVPNDDLPTDPDDAPALKPLSLRLKQPHPRNEASVLPAHRRNPLRPSKPTALPSLQTRLETSLDDQYQPIIPESLTASAAPDTLRGTNQSPDRGAVPHVASPTERGPINKEQIPTTNEDQSETGVERWHPVSKQPIPSPHQKQADDNTQRHQVRDGDSLPAIAKRYLGDESRYLEVYDLNRDILISPDVLPIGLKLRLPTGHKPP